MKTWSPSDRPCPGMSTPICAGGSSRFRFLQRFQRHAWTANAMSCISDRRIWVNHGTISQLRHGRHDVELKPRTAASVSWHADTPGQQRASLIERFRK
eukprot:960634-Rhodomonas_salina.2